MTLTRCIQLYNCHFIFRLNLFPFISSVNTLPHNSPNTEFPVLFFTLIPSWCHTSIFFENGTKIACGRESQQLAD